MLVYLVKYSGGEYEDAFEIILGIYDELDVAKYECMQIMKHIEENGDGRDVDEIVIEEWKINFGYERDVNEWWRAKGGKYGHFIPREEWVTGVTKLYERYED